MNRLQQKNNLLMQLGALFGPLVRLVERPDDYDEQERAQTIARYCAEAPQIRKEFEKFSLGEPGHNYAVENNKFGHAIQTIITQLSYGNGNREFPELVQTELALAQAAIDAIPVAQDSIILEAGTPFSTYCTLKELCEADTTSSLVWVDAYHDMNVFHRFLRGVRPGVTITLVTSEPRTNAGARDRARWNEFLDISRLFALERGNTSYRLVVHQGLLHDRWLLLDQKRLYSFGGSAKDAGSRQYFTIARIDTSVANLQIIATHINSGTEHFGPNTLQHL